MKIRILLFVLLTSSILISCLTGKPKIGLLVHSLETPRWNNDQKYFTDAVNQLGGTAIVDVAENDEQKQIDQAKQMIASGVSVLVLIPVNQFTAGKIVDMAHKSDVKVIAYDRMVNNCWLDYYVSSDNIRIGEIQAEFIKNLKPTGNYALIGGPTYDNNSRMIYIGQMNILQPLIERDQIKVIYNVFSDSWTGQEGYKHTLEALDASNGKLDAILAGNDAMALGVLKALKERGVEGKVAVAGQDADLPNIQEIIKGNQAMTVYKPIKTMAYTAAELAVNLAENKPLSQATATLSNGNRLVPSYLVNPMGVNESNIQMTVVAEGYQEANKILK